MSNFFGSTEVKTSFDLGGNKFPPIPEGTKVKAVIDEAKWDTYQDESFVSLRWSVLAGEFINRKSMVIRLAVWEINGKDGNWINAVESGAPNGQLPPQAPKKADAFDPAADIPF